MRSIRGLYRPQPRVWCALFLLHSVAAGAQNCVDSNTDPNTETGTFFHQGSATSYTFVAPTPQEYRNGHLLIRGQSTTGLHASDPCKDNRVVQSDQDLVAHGYAVASVEFVTQGWRIDEQLDRLTEFARWLRQVQHPWLTGKVYIKGGSRGGWHAILAVLRHPDVFDGALATNAVCDLESTAQYRSMTMFSAFGLQLHGLANNNVWHSAMGQDAIGGPARDRDQGGQPAASIAALSATALAGSLTRPIVLICGDSDVVVGQAGYWNLVDELDQLGLQGLYKMFSVPADGHKSPGPGAEAYFGDLRFELFDWVEGRPTQYAPGVYGPRHVSTETVRTFEEVYAVDPAFTPNSLLVKKFTYGTGAWPGGLDGSIVVADPDGDGKETVFFGNFDGFVEEWDLAGTPPACVWRSADLGSRIFGLTIGDANNDGVDEILAGDDRGVVHAFSAFLPRFELPVAFVDDEHGLFEPVWDLRVVDVETDGQNELLLRTQDGYLHLIRGGNKSRSGYIGATMGSGFDVRDLDGDGSLEIVVGDASGFAHLYRASDLQPLQSSTYLGVFPFQALLANVKPGPDRQIVCGGYVGSWGRKSAGETFTFVPASSQPGNLQLIDQRDDFGSFFGSVAANIDTDARDELFLAGIGGVQVLDLPDLTPQSWQPTSPARNSVYHGVAVGDVDGDAEPEVVAMSREGSLFSFDAATRVTEVEVEGWGGAFGLALADVGGTDRPEILVGTRLGQIHVINGKTGSVKSTLKDVPFWPHRIEVENVDQDAQVEIIVGTGNGINAKAEFESGCGTACSEGALFVLDGSDGSIEASTPLGQTTGALWGLHIEDLDGDGQSEIVAGSESTPEDGGRAKLFVFHHDGTALTLMDSLQVEGHGLYGMDAADVTGDGNIELLVGDRRGYLKLYHYDAGGGIRELAGFVPRDHGSYLNVLQVHELDGSTPPEVLCGLEEGVVKVLRWNGSDLAEVAETPDIGTHAWGICVEDLDANGVLDIAVGSAEGSIFVFQSSDMSFLGRIAGLGSFVGAYGSLQAADVDGDGALEVVAGSTGYLHVLDVNLP